MRSVRFGRSIDRAKAMNVLGKTAYWMDGEKECGQRNDRVRTVMTEKTTHTLLRTVRKITIHPKDERTYVVSAQVLMLYRIMRRMTDFVLWGGDSSSAHASVL